MAVLTLGPALLDLKGVRAGDRNLIAFTFTSDDVAVNLTGSTVTAQARKSASTVDPPALVADVVVVDAVNGKVTVAWDGEDVRALLDGAEAWSGVWDLQILTPPDEPVTVVGGSFGAVMDVTR